MFLIGRVEMQNDATSQTSQMSSELVRKTSAETVLDAGCIEELVSVFYIPARPIRHTMQNDLDEFQVIVPDFC